MQADHDEHSFSNTYLLGGGVYPELIIIKSSLSVSLLPTTGRSTGR